MVLFPDLVDLASHTEGVSTSHTPTESNHPALEDPAHVTLFEMPHPKPTSGDVVYSSLILLLPYMTKNFFFADTSKVRIEKQIINTHVDMPIVPTDSEKFQLPPRSIFT